MKPFYELYRDYESKLTVSNRTDYSFPPHFHASVEILVLIEGKYKVMINNTSYIAEGKCVIISDSFNIHAFSKLSDGPSNSMLIIIPASYLIEYNLLKKNKSLKESICTNKKIVDEIYQLSHYMIIHDNDESVKQHYADVIISLLIKELGLKEAGEQKSTTTIKNVLSYIEDHFKEDISLEIISQYFGYSTCHLSRLFHSYFEMSISRYINNMRIQYIEANKKNNNKLTFLIYEAGFNSPQTYYRNLKSYKNWIY